MAGACTSLTTSLFTVILDLFANLYFPVTLSEQKDFVFERFFVDAQNGGRR